MVFYRFSIVVKGEGYKDQHHQEDIKEKRFKKTSTTASSITAGIVATTLTGGSKKMPSDYKANLAEHEITEFPQYSVNKDCEDGKAGDK